MDEHEETTPQRGVRPVHRRAVLRGAAWTTPVVLAAVAAPAMAASVGPLTVTAYKTLITQQVVIAFSGGQSSLTVTVLSISVRFNSTDYDVSFSPTNVSSISGYTYGRLLSSWLLLTLNYTVSYSFNGQTYTTVVSA